MFSDYYQNLLSKNPKLREPGASLTISAAEFLRHIERAYAEGERSASQHRRAYEDFARFGQSIKNPFEGLFGL